MEAIVICLLVYTVVRELFFYHQTNKLLNKLMSRNYHEYQVSEQVEKSFVPKRIKVDGSYNEDLGVLGELNGVS